MNNKNKTLNCVVHYRNQTRYSSIKKLSDINQRRILEARERRILAGEDNLHQEQLDLIPSEFDLDEHGIHMNSCYKRYALILIRNVSF